MSAITQPYFSAALSTPECANGATTQSVLAETAVTSPILVALFRRSDLKLLMLNASGRRWLTPDIETDLGDITLSAVLGIEGAARLNSTLLRADLHGHWSGHCNLRSTWGSEIPVFASLTTHLACENRHEPWLCLQAVQASGTGNPDYLRTSDHVLLHAALQATPDAIYFKDRHSRFIRLSRALARKDGLADDDLLIGKTDFDRFTPEHAQQAYEDEKRIIETGEPIIEKVEKETWPDGRTTWVSTSKFPLIDLDGNTIGTFGISHDITEQRLAEEKTREMEIKLQLGQKLESIGRLAAGVAHEINTPTQFISDNTRFITTSFPQIVAVLESYRALRDAVADQPALAAALAAVAQTEAENDCAYLLDEIPRTLAQTLEGLGRIARIVRSLKEFSHPNSPKPTPVDLNRTIETTIAVTRHEWKYVANVVTELDPELPPVPCVVDEFNQVMLNLIVNAAHAIESALKASGRSDSGTITIRTRREDHFAVVEVEDTGTGIPIAAQAHIFDPFFTTKEVGKGTGQGLAIVHTVIVKHHAGSVDFRSEEGVGTTFRLRFPLNSDAQAQVSP